MRKLEDFHAPEVNVKCLDCERVFPEGKLLVEDIESSTDYCPFCGSTNILDLDEKTEATA